MVCIAALAGFVVYVQLISVFCTATSSTHLSLGPALTLFSGTQEAGAGVVQVLLQGRDARINGLDLLSALVGRGRGGLRGIFGDSCTTLAAALALAYRALADRGAVLYK